ncbi:glycosyltransferase family 4 protein [Leeuwenhoekiella sp. LLG6367-2.1]|uniref:glycosyltransferase family 4 protein n=1 Tax=Leeuwenhoekiella sp. LLG6367-2.1 TaxID=3160833 RepID=UPI00386B335D
MASRFGLSSLVTHETGIFSVDAMYHDLDKKVSLSLAKNPQIDAVYAYEDGAFHTFSTASKLGIVCLYDLPIGYWRAMHEILERDRILYPEWSQTLTGLKDSKQKLARKDAELHHADHIIVASSFTKKTLETYPNRLAPVHVIPYGFPEGIPIKTYSDTSLRKLKLLFVGGLSQRKGIAQLFEVCELLKDQVSLKVIGRKPIEDCEVLNNSLKKVEWISSCSHPEILTEMRDADIFVFPSLFEGYGLVIAEAMAQGTPVITTSHTCGADYIRDGENGWLVKAGDSKSLETKLQHILKNPELIEDAGILAFETAQENPNSQYSQKVSALVTDLISRSL